MSLSKWFFVGILLLACSDGIVLGHPKLRPATLLYPLLVSIAYIYAALIGRVNGTQIKIMLVLLCGYPLLLVVATEPFDTIFSSAQGLFITVFFSSLCTAMMVASLKSARDNNAEFNSAIIITLTIISIFTLIEFVLRNLYSIEINDLIGWARSDVPYASESIANVKFYRSYALSDEPTIAAFNAICLFLMLRTKMATSVKIVCSLAFATYFSLLSVIVILFLVSASIFSISAKAALKITFLMVALAGLGVILDASLLSKFANILDSARVSSNMNLFRAPIDCLLFGEYSCGPSDSLVLGLFGFIIQKFGIFGIAIFAIILVGTVVASSRRFDKQVFLRLAVVGLFFSANAVLHSPLVWLLLFTYDNANTHISKSS